jgi:hypothetical protein
MPAVAPPTPAEVIAGCQATATGSLYIVGCLERRVTLYSQQVRALNLVHALIETGKLTATKKIAVVGAGAAGLTAAAAIVRAFPDIRTLDVYERMPELLHLQTASHSRSLHPHLYDWPTPGAMQPRADLPVLDWSAGPASQVAETLLADFERITGSSWLRTHTEHTVERVDEFVSGGCRLRIANVGTVGPQYDLCLLTIGYGMERYIERGENVSYWNPSYWVGPLRGPQDRFTLVVSGNGDGGLVDFLFAAFDGRTHDDILSLVIDRSDLGPVVEELLKIEAEAWASPNDFDIHEAYIARLTSLLPPGLIGAIADALRSNASVTLHTQKPRLFRKDTAILNRFLVFLALAADRDRRRFLLQVIAGHEIDNDPRDPELVFTNAVRLRPDRRSLRFGTDTQALQEPFRAHFDAFRARRPVDPAEFRPATPLLCPGVRERFAAPSGIGDGGLQPTMGETVPQTVSTSVPAGIQGNVAAQAASGTRQLAVGGRDDAVSFDATTFVHLTKAATSTVRWRSHVPSADASRVWHASAPTLFLQCELTPEEAGPLRFAIARLVMHARDYRLHCENSIAWTQFLRGFFGEHRPGPAIDTHFRARRCLSDLPDDAPSEEMSINELASRIHLSLDHDALTRLNEKLEAALRPEATVTAGWVLERSLRAEMLVRWREWYARLGASDAQRRRFLVLLVSPDDASDLTPGGFVRVGPKCVEAHILRAAVLALAFSLSTEPAIQPNGSFPGNVSAPSLSAHALGVSWLNGVDIGANVQERAWSTDVVLLSEMQATPLPLPTLPRMDHADDSDGMRIVPLHEQTLVIGCTQAVRAALSIGEQAVRDHFKALLRDRANAAARAID